MKPSKIALLKKSSSAKRKNGLKNSNGKPSDVPANISAGEKTLKLILDSIGMQVWLIKEDKPGKYIFDEVSPSFASYQNTSPEHIKGKPIESVFRASGLTALTESLKAAKKKGTFSYEFETDAGDTVKYFSSRIAYNENFGKPYYIGTTSEVTEQKLVLEKFEREKENAGKYLEIAGVIIVVLDTNGCVTMINKKGCDILKLDRESIIGKDWFENFTPSQYSKELKNSFNQLMKGKEPESYFENSIINNAGVERLVYWHNSILKDPSGRITGLISSGEDITENRKIQSELVAQKKHTEFLYLFSRSISEASDLNDLVLKASNMLSDYADVLGGKICIYKGEDYENCFESTTFGIYESAITDSVKTKKTPKSKKPEQAHSIENIEYFLDGEKLNAFTGTYALYFKHELQGTLIIFTRQMDPIMNSFFIHVATEMGRAVKRKKLEIEKRYSDEKFLSVFNASPDAMAITELTTQIFVEVNKGFEEMTGYRRDECLGKTPVELNTWVYPAEREKLIKKLLEEKKISGFLTKLRKKDGVVFDALFSAANMNFGSKKCMVAVVKDISEMVKIENEIRNTKQLLENITYTSPSFISLYNVSSDKILYSNKSLLASLGYTDEDLEVIVNLGGKNRYAFYHPDDIEYIKEFDRRIQELNEGEVIKIDYRIKDTKSVWQWFHHSASVYQRAHDGLPLLTINVFENITDRKQAEAESDKHTNEIELLYQAGKHLSSTLDLYEIYDRMYEIISKVADCNELIVTSYDPAKQLIYYKYLKSKATESRINVSNIPPIPLAPKGFGINSEVIRTGKSIIINDYEEYFKKVKTRYVLTDQGEIVGDQKSTQSPNSALIIPIKLEDKILGVVQIYSTRYKAYNEEQLKFVESIMHQVALANKNAIVFEQAQNEIRERKIAQNNLKKSERNLRQFAESVPDVLYRLNYETGKYDFLSPVIEIMLGYEISEALDDPYGFSDKIVHPDDRKMVEEAILNHNKNGMVAKPLNVECRMFRNDGTMIWVRDSIKFEYRQGKIVAAIGAMSDITDEKIQEEKRRKRDEKIIKQQAALLELSKYHFQDIEANFRKINEIAAYAIGVDRASIWLFDKDEVRLVCRDRYTLNSETHDKNIILSSEEYSQLFKKFKADEKLIFKNLEKDQDVVKFMNNVQSDIDTRATFLSRVHLHGGVAGFFCLESKDVTRTEWTVEEYDFAVSVSGFISLALESEERMQAENEIKKSLKDKELLLREIHHRVKNNLAVISSLLYLQSKKVSDGYINDALLESQMRIRSMVMIHERLYKSEDLSGIDYGEYINELTNTLFRSYRLDSSKVKLELDVGEIRFDTDTAVHCGLIINELVSNSFKHAFPNNRHGTIKIKLHSDENRNYTLIVSDNGIGLKEDFEIDKSDTLGIQLIKTLTEQLGGTFKINKDEGTSFIVRFHLENQTA